MEIVEKIVCFDFDDTLVFTPKEEPGKIKWEEFTGIKFPHDGWWSKPESLDLEIFDIPVNPFVYQKYLDACAEEGTLPIMATGRLDKTWKGERPEKRPDLTKPVLAILRSHNIDFGEHTYLCTGIGDTYRFKTKLYTRLIEKYSPKTFVMYDDRHAHLVKFIEEWAPEQECTIEIIDVTKSDKTPIIIN
jgi:hypothetical protein